MDKYMTQDAEVLEKAADLIDTVGHCKHRLYDTDRDGQVIAYCLIGGIWAALGTEHATTTGRRLLDRLGFKKFGYVDAAVSIIDWNNADERTGAEVVDLLKETAKDLRNAA